MGREIDRKGFLLLVMAIGGLVYGLAVGCSC